MPLTYGIYADAEWLASESDCGITGRQRGKGLILSGPNNTFKKLFLLQHL